MLFAPAAPKTRGIKVEEYFSQRLVQIYFKKLRHNISRHFSGRKRKGFIQTQGSLEIEFSVKVSHNIC